MKENYLKGSWLVFYAEIVGVYTIYIIGPKIIHGGPFRLFKILVIVS